jgi:hypothetical protein
MVQPDKNQKLGAFKDQMIEKHEQVLRASMQLVPIANGLLDQEIGEPLHKVLRAITRIVVNSNGAAIETATSGYGNDAAKIVRSMFEGAITIAYPAYEPLLTAALEHAGQAVGLSYPRDRWYVRAVMAFDNGVRRLRGGAFRTFVHAPTGMSALLRAGGFQLVGRRTTLTWSVDVYTRMNAAAQTR